MPDNPHMGHRQRMLDKFRRFGLEIFSDLRCWRCCCILRYGRATPTRQHTG